jgi:hypothetical protein
MSAKDLLAMVEDVAKKVEVPKTEADKKAAVSKDDEMKVIEEVVSRKILDKFHVGSYLPLVGGLFYDEITALKRLHGLILDFELQSAITSLIRPTSLDVLKTLRMIEDASKSPLALADKANVLLSQQGVPVYVNPTIIENT